MDSILYATHSIVIAALLLTAILLANEFGYRFGRWRQKNTAEEIKDQTSAITASILGLLALLLGFTFTMSVQRFDNRAGALLDEANAIGTAQLRSELLPPEQQASLNKLFAQYIDTRIRNGQVSTANADERSQLQREESALIAQLWKQTIAAVEADPRPLTSGLFLQAMNDLIDARDKRNASVERHVPAVVIYLLFTVFILTCGFLGYGSGLSGRRAYIAMLLLGLIIVSVMFLVIDLDRPRRGLVQVNQAPLLNLALPVLDLSK